MSREFNLIPLYLILPEKRGQKLGCMCPSFRCPVSNIQATQFEYNLLCGSFNFTYFNLALDMKGSSPVCFCIFCQVKDWASSQMTRGGGGGGWGGGRWGTTTPSEVWAITGLSLQALQVRLWCYQCSESKPT